MGEDDSEDGAQSLLPTFVSPRSEDTTVPRISEPRNTVRLGGSMPDDSEDGSFPEFTHTLMPLDRPMGTMSVTPSNGISAQRGSDENSDTLINSQLAAQPKVEKSRRRIGLGAMGMGIVAVLAAGISLATRPVELLPLTPLDVPKPAAASMSEHDLAFLARRWPATSAALETPEPTPTPTPTPTPSPSSRSRSSSSRTPASAAPSPSSSPSPSRSPSPSAAPTTDGPDAIANIVARRGNEAAAAEIFIDGRLVGQAPLRLPLRPGRHLFEAKKATSRASKTVDVAPGKTLRIVLDLEDR